MTLCYKLYIKSSIIALTQHILLKNKYRDLVQDYNFVIFCYNVRYAIVELINECVGIILFMCRYLHFLEIRL